MRLLTTRREMAKEINLKRTTTVRIDLADANEMGLKSQRILIDNGTFRDGNPYLIEAYIFAGADDMKFSIISKGACLKNDFDYYDVEEMVYYANAPVVKKDSDVVLVFVNSKKKEVYCPAVLHTSDTINEGCMEPLTFVDEDNCAARYMAETDYRAEYFEALKRKYGL